MLTVILILGLVARAWNLFGYPAFSDDEGTYVAQAWAVRNGLGLAHYTYIYDHPPLGWIQIAALSWIPTFVAPSLPAVAAGRIVMLVFAGVSIVLLYYVARRLRFSNWAALAATAVFAFSPLAIALHRQVFLDNIAVTWILVAFLLALSPRQHLGLQMLAGVAAAVSVLSKETLILAVPAILLALWQNSHPRTRNFATIGFVCGFVATSAFYPLYAVLKGELLWRDRDRVSMLEMLVYQLFGREGSGSVFDSQSQAYETLVGWSLQDATILIVGTVSATVALFIRRLRAARVGRHNSDPDRRGQAGRLRAGHARGADPAVLCTHHRRRGPGADDRSPFSSRIGAVSLGARSCLHGGSGAIAGRATAVVGQQSTRVDHNRSTIH